MKAGQEGVHMSCAKEVKDFFVDNQDGHFGLCSCYLPSEWKSQHIPARGPANVLKTAALCIKLVKLAWPEWS